MYLQYLYILMKKIKWIIKKLKVYPHFNLVIDWFVSEIQFIFPKKLLVIVKNQRE